MTFQIDTSGAVSTHPDPDVRMHGHLFQWSDLSPFAQGYVEALFAELWASNPTRDGQALQAQYLAFTDLAPETLARIIADCADADKGQPGPHENGSAFWRVRNHPLMPQGVGASNFPPLTVQLCDDGKVRFAT